MAISADTAQGLSKALGITSGSMATLLGLAMANGSASGYTDVSEDPMSGVMLTVHHAGDRTFTIELH